MDLKYLFAPKSIAIVGASADKNRIGGRLYNYLMKHGYKGKIYPVNPKYKSVYGTKCYFDIEKIKSKIDVALLAVKNNLVNSVLDSAGRNKVPSAIIYSSGYSETGKNGSLKQKELNEIAKKYNIAICGPNCVGLINFKNKIAMSFSQFLNIEKLKFGQVGFISQSGALGGSLLNRAHDRNLGISYFVSTGNEANIESSQYLEYMVNDAKTNVIMMILEGIRNSTEFFRVAELAAKKNKPIVVMKVGKTDAGKMAAKSHTGSIAGSDEVYDAAFKKYGIVRVDDFDDLIYTASAFVKKRIPKGKRVAIITSTGGGGVVLVDKLVTSGLDVPNIPKKLTNELKKIVPSYASINNPLDLTAQLTNDPLLFKNCISLFSNDKKFDSIIIATSMVSGNLSKKRASFIIEASKHIDIPIFTWWAGGSLSSPGIKMLEKNKDVVFFDSAEKCVNTLKNITLYANFKKVAKTATEKKRKILKRNKEKVREIINNSYSVVTEDLGSEILSHYGVPVAKSKLGRTVDEVLEISKSISFPLALKIVSPDIQHKTEAKGVRLGIKSKNELVSNYKSLIESVKKYNPNARIKGVLVQEMLLAGEEVIIGIKKDVQFGPTILFGMGGIFVELFKDYSLRLAPVSHKDALEMVQETKCFKVLNGFRNKPKYDLDKLADVLVRISLFAADFESLISELDINPLMVYPEGRGVKVIDSLIVKSI